MNELLKKFNLPSYIDGLSFSESSKKIHDKGKGRVDPEWLATEKDMLGRLKEMQEYVAGLLEQRYVHEVELQLADSELQLNPCMMN